MLLAEAGCVIMGFILCISDLTTASCVKDNCTQGEISSSQQKSEHKLCSAIEGKVLKLKLQPKTVTVGDTVTLICSMDCLPFPNTTYTWYLRRLNSKPLKIQQNQNKHIHSIYTVSSDQEGKYYCVARNGINNITSKEVLLTIKSNTNTYISAAVTGASASLLVTIPVIVFIWIRTKRSVGQSSTTPVTDNAQQLNSETVYENIPAQSTEQDEPYSRVHFYPTVQTHPPREHEHPTYAVINFRPYV